MRLIDANEYEKRIKPYDTEDDMDKALYNFAHYHLVTTPSAQPERKKGKWERHYSRPNVYKDLCWHCSECGYKSSNNWADKWNYCPNCGCEMER